jgi:hypothetical protein
MYFSGVNSSQKRATEKQQLFGILLILDFLNCGGFQVLIRLQN